MFTPEYHKNTYLLKLKDVLVDVILQFLISVVDTQLLQAIFLEVLESKHIQDANGQTLKTKQQTGHFKTSTKQTI